MKRKHLITSIEEMEGINSCTLLESMWESRRTAFSLDETASVSSSDSDTSADSCDEVSGAVSTENTTCSRPGQISQSDDEENDDADASSVARDATTQAACYTR